MMPGCTALDMNIAFGVVTRLYSTDRRVHHEKLSMRRSPYSIAAPGALIKKAVGALTKAS